MRNKYTYDFDNYFSRTAMQAARNHKIKFPLCVRLKVRAFIRTGKLSGKVPWTLSRTTII